MRHASAQQKNNQRMNNIFRIKKEERLFALITLIVIIAFNVLMITYHFDDFGKPKAGFWTLFTKNFQISGFDPYTYLTLSKWKVYYTEYRHPMLPFFLYPFSPFLGWLGVFLTGSDTSSNALFAALQATAAQQIGVSDILLVAANTTGGVTGKMISPQSIAIACAAVGLVGKESDLFRFTVKHSLIFTCMVGVITTLQAYVLTWMIP